MDHCLGDNCLRGHPSRPEAPHSIDNTLKTVGAVLADPSIFDPHYCECFCSGCITARSFEMLRRPKMRAHGGSQREQAWALIDVLDGIHSVTRKDIQAVLSGTVTGSDGSIDGVLWVKLAQLAESFSTYREALDAVLDIRHERKKSSKVT